MMGMKWRKWFLEGRGGEEVNGTLPRCQLGRLRVVMCILCDSNPSVFWCSVFNEVEEGALCPPVGSLGHQAKCVSLTFAFRCSSSYHTTQQLDPPCRSITAPCPINIFVSLTSLPSCACGCTTI